MADPGQNRDEAARASAAHAAVDPAVADAGPTPPASSDLRENGTVAPGDCLAGRFLIEQELGRGGAGTVFIAQDRTLGRSVAIKVLTHAPDAHALARFAQEARAAGALEHPNVLAVHDVGVHEGVPFIVSELLRGRTLRARLGEGPLQAREATDLALQLARGLVATHEQGILHRDLKPENLFLLEDGRLKILDFGLAKLLPSAPTGGDRDPGGNLGTVSGAILGTVPYMSPEQVRGRPADARSDVFAFGAVLHEMLSGTAPFAGESPFDVGHAILNAEPCRLPEGTPAALRTLVRRCLAKDPEARVQSARELVQLLETVAPAPRASKWRTGRFWVFAAGALWAALLATVAAPRLRSERRRRSPLRRARRDLDQQAAPGGTIPAIPARRLRHGRLQGTRGERSRGAQRIRRNADREREPAVEWRQDPRRRQSRRCALAAGSGGAGLRGGRSRRSSHRPATGGKRRPDAGARAAAGGPACARRSALARLRAIPGGAGTSAALRSGREHRPRAGGVRQRARPGPGVRAGARGQGRSVVAPLSDHPRPGGARAGESEQPPRAGAGSRSRAGSFHCGPRRPQRRRIRARDRDLEEGAPDRAGKRGHDARARERLRRRRQGGRRGNDVPACGGAPA